MLFWNYALFIKPYSLMTYPAATLERLQAAAPRKHNIVYPYAAMGRALDQVLGEGGKFPSVRGCYLWRTMPDIKVKALITNRNLCENRLSMVKEYAQSGVRLYKVNP